MSERSDLIKALRMALTANEQAESLERLNASYQTKTERLEPWLLQTLDEVDALNCDLDDMQAEWAACEEGRGDQALSQTRLIEQLGTQKRELETSLLEERRLKVAAFEKIMDLEKTATPMSVETDRRIAHAVAELRNLATAETITAAEVLRIANSLHCGPKAPSIPRRPEL